MSKMDQTQFTKACGALAKAWNNISESGDVFSVSVSITGNVLEAQMQWETMCAFFPDERIKFFERGCEEYPWEGKVAVEGVRVMALLTGEQKREVDKEAE